MEPRRSQRKPKPTTIWEQKGAPSAAKDPKITKKTARTEKKTALKPIAIGPLSEATNLNEKRLPELLKYDPPLKLYFNILKSLIKGLSELDTFQQLLTPAIVEEIVQATNNYAENARETEELNSFARL
jgi:hypothetical protein